MSISRDCNIRQIQGRVILSPASMAFIARMPILQGHEWDKKLVRPPWLFGDLKILKALKKEISSLLKVLQGDFCAYCGMSFYVTSSTQIEHIAPKGTGRYPQFMFHTSNLVHACSLCNGFEKKEVKANINTIDLLNANYDLCTFNIVHPYLHNPDEHYDLQISLGKVLISHKTPQGKKSIEIFKLDDEPLTIERGKMIMEKLYTIDPLFQDAFDAAVAKRGY